MWGDLSKLQEFNLDLPAFTSSKLLEVEGSESDGGGKGGDGGLGNGGADGPWRKVVS